MSDFNEAEADAIYGELNSAYSKLDFANLEIFLNIKADTLKDILKNDSDWSMIIKMGVFLEATLERLLTTRITQMPNSFLEKLNINGRTGKLQLACELDLIDITTKRRIETLIEIRNNFAHKLEHINHSLLDFYKKFEDRNDYWDNLFPKKEHIRLLYWCTGVLALKSLSDSIVISLKDNYARDVELLSAYISKDYSKDTFRKYLTIGKDLINKLDNHSNHLIAFNKKY